MNTSYLEIAVECPIPEPLTYLENSEFSLIRGQSVKVPLGKRKVNGVVLQNNLQADPKFKVKHVDATNNERPILPEPTLKWLEWIAKYYLHPIGQVTSLAFPPLKKNTKPRASKRPEVVPTNIVDKKIQLNTEQFKVFESISKQNDFQTNLLFGVTGSGKTEVYMNLLASCLEKGQSGIVLVPEISLTPQLIQRFSARFPNMISVLHSQLTERERTNQWWNIIEGKTKILIGARSAIFCPLENIGIIVVDEEHEPSFKQDEKLKYHGRDCAIMLAKYHNCPIVLGSATPSLESWHNTISGKYHLHKISNRVADRKMPNIEVIDLKDEKKSDDRIVDGEKLPFWLSRSLFDVLERTLAEGFQSALFLNRRGSAQLVICGDCGYTYECPNCSISLTLHGNNYLVCHYCDYSCSYQENCPDCKEGEIEKFGLGTEKIEEDLKKLFPSARLIRADRDEIQSRKDLESFIEKVEAHEVDILIGTQMIAKGLDFPKLITVGLVLADIGFNLPDFRAGERSFQLLTQMSGRAGRHSVSPGQVIIQSYNPQHKSIVFAQAHSFESFAEFELNNRKELTYPPFGKVAMLKLKGQNYDRVHKSAEILSYRARELCARHKIYQAIQVLGPCPAPIAKIRGHHRYHLLIKSTQANLLNSFCRQVIGNSKWLETATKVQVDIDPLNML